MKHNILIAKKKLLPANSKKGFMMLEGINREIIPSHVSKIAESIQTYQQIVRQVIVAKLSFLPNSGGKLYIIDGQHLYIACIRLKCDIPYEEILVEIKSLPELIEKIALLNTSSKSWTLENYIKTWAYYKTEYQVFLELFRRYNMERVILAELLHTGVVSAAATHSGKHTITKAIKTGKLRIVNQELAIKVLDYANDLRAITKDLGRIEQKLLISTIIEKIKADGGDYDHIRFKKYLIQIKEKLLLASNDVDTLRRLFSK